ncbi:hypothetical protein RI129_008380 [Pyrocoelia pectoralis]|uniref:28S ribosomal protein S34, mitochondrial n=1 Tax=Pyrocoelia pectoralis TaxID=417401 RepID=A0AAN7VB42_9COLE
MPIKYIGKSIDFKGKTLWEILGNLKNFGVGRIIARNMFERYPEPSYIKIMKVETVPNPETNTPDDMRKVRVWCENTFRGRKFPELYEVFATSYKADYKLIPKYEEAEYCKCDNPRVHNKVLPKTTSFPPLLRELIMRDMKARGEVVEEPQLKIIYNVSQQSHYRAAENDESPTEPLQKGFGKAVTSTLQPHQVSNL